MESSDINTLELTQQLIARRSVSPEDAGCLELVIAELKPLGFEWRNHRHERHHPPVGAPRPPRSTAEAG